MVESSIVKYKTDVIDYSIGTSCKVEFNFLNIWDTISKDKEFNSAHLVFTHVHPPGALGYSPTDFNCMKGFSIAFNGGIYFDIIIFDNYDLFSLSHICKSYYYRFNGVVELEINCNSGLKNSELLFLKYLSYGNNLD